MSSNGFSIGTPGQTMLQFLLNCISLVCIIPYSSTAMLKMHVEIHLGPTSITFYQSPFQKLKNSNGFSLCPYLLPIVYLENPFSPHEPRALHAPHPRLADRQASRKDALGSTNPATQDAGSLVTTQDFSSNPF